jgi:DNA-binding transcriptional ArsR family regulator
MSNLDIVFQALSDPTRRAILSRLIEGECNVGELAKPFAMTMPAISKHISLLEKSGLIVRGRDKQMRPCKLHYAAFKEIDQYLSQYRRVLNQRLDKRQYPVNE